ncbi:MAG: EF hand [candidate division BRC1 bacterium ADurb.BinA364]|nr:MAG: EF hand [candidate division BRC1 bacterium ADurb.BinA364]
MMERMGGFRPPNVLMEALDADKNGIISAKEIEGAVAALKKLDKNADGQLTADELAPPSPAGAGFVDRIMAMDANKDGKVTKEEAPEQMQRLFERADTNADGAIDKAEAEAAGQVMQRMGGREQGGAPGPEAAAERPRRQRTEAQE